MHYLKLYYKFIMKENGVVKKVVSQNLAEVELKRLSACKNCRACGAISESQGSFIIEAINDIGAKQHDIVEIEIPSSDVLSVSALVFLTPIILIIVGYVFGQLVGNYLELKRSLDLISGGFAVLFCAIFFIALPVYDKFIKQKKKT